MGNCHPRNHPPPRPADPSQKWRGAASRPSARSGRGPPNTATTGPPSQEWRGTATGTRSQEWQATTHHRRQRTTARSGGEPHPGLSAWSGEEHPPPPTGQPSQEWREIALTNLHQESRGTNHGTHQPHPQPHQRQAPAGLSHTPTHTHTHTNTHGRHTHTHATPNARHTHQDRHHARTHRATNTDTTRNPHPTPRKRPPPRPGDPSQEWHRTVTRTTPKRGKQPHTTTAGGPQPGVARDRTRGPEPAVARNTHHHRQHNPARRGGETHAGTSVRSGEGPPTQQPQPHPD